MADKPTPPVLLMTRPRAASERFVGMLEEKRVALGRVVHAPAIGIEQLQVSRVFGDVAAVILTSANAVTAPAWRPGIPAWCVGDATAEAADRAGFDVINAGGTVDDLVALIVAERPQGRLIYLRGEHVSSDLASRLDGAGLDVSERIVYAQPELPPPPEAVEVLSSPGHVVAPLFSPRSAAICNRWAANGAADVIAVAMSEAVAANWRGEVRIARKPTPACMVDEVARLFGG